MILNIPLSFNYFSPLSGLEVLPWGQRSEYNYNEAQELLDENTHHLNGQNSKWKRKGKVNQKKYALKEELHQGNANHS